MIKQFSKYMYRFLYLIKINEHNEPIKEEIKTIQIGCIHISTSLTNKTY
jgi:hypothetical protein